MKRLPVIKLLITTALVFAATTALSGVLHSEKSDNCSIMEWGYPFTFITKTPPSYAVDFGMASLDLLLHLIFFAALFWITTAWITKLGRKKFFSPGNMAILFFIDTVLIMAFLITGPGVFFKDDCPRASTP